MNKIIVNFNIILKETKYNGVGSNIKIIKICIDINKLKYIKKKFLFNIKKNRILSIQNF